MSFRLQLPKLLVILFVFTSVLDLNAQEPGSVGWTFSKNPFNYKVIAIDGEVRMVEVTGNPLLIIDVVIPEPFNKGFTIAGKGYEFDFVVKGISTNAFYNNDVYQLSLPSTLKTIGESAFFNSKITELIIPNNVTSIREDAFFGNKINNLQLGSSLDSIGISAFSNNEITELIIPNSVTTIGEKAFLNNNLTSITLGNSLQEIGARAFYNSFNNNIEGIQNLVIPNSVMSIGGEAFYGHNITNITIPASLTSIGSGAFSKNPINKVISLNTTPAQIENNAFSDNNYNNINLIIPAGTKTAYENAGWVGFNIIEEDYSLPVITGLSPAKNSVDVDFNPKLEITFSEKVKKGTGIITIYKTEDNSIVEEINVTTNKVTINNSVVSISPSITLEYGKNYYVKIEDTVFKDLLENPFEGIFDIDTWNFTAINFTPGGIFSNLQLWLKANDGLNVETVNTINFWEDKSVNNRTAESINDPIKKENSFNFNPTVSFTKLKNQQFSINLNALDNSDYNIISVVKGVNSRTYNLILRTSTLIASDLIFGYKNNKILTLGDSVNDLDVSLPEDDNQKKSPSIIRGELDLNTGRNLSELRDGNLFSNTDSNKTPLKNIENSVLGPQIGLEGFDGEIAEFIVYNSTLNELDLAKINSYLAIKYGLTLNNNGGDSNGDYISSDGVVLWDASKNNNYHNNIALITKDEASALHQPKSKSENSSAVVTIEKENGFTNYNNSIAIGSNSGTMTYIRTGNEGNPDGFLVTERIWKIQKTGNLDNINFTFKLEENTGLAEDYKLIKSNSETNFSSNTSVYDVTNINENSITFNNVDTSNNSYYRLAKLIYPEIKTQSPTNNSTSIDIDPEFELRFTTPIEKGSGNITIHNLADNSIVETIDVLSNQVSITEDTVTISTSNNLRYFTNYYINIGSNAFKNSSNKNFEGISDNTSWRFTTKNRFNVDDIEYQVVVNSSPAVVEAINYTGSDSRISIPEEVEDAGELLTVTGIGINAFSGKQLNNISLPSSIIYIGENAFLNNNITDVTSKSISPAFLPNNAFQNKNNIDLFIPENVDEIYQEKNWTGFKNTYEDNFLEPTITEFFPANNAENIPLNTNLTLNFNENIFKGTGEITIYNGEDNSVYEVIDVLSNQVTIANNSITIDPINTFEFNKKYYVKINENAFKDIQSNSIVGISDSTIWSFKTKTITPGGNFSGLQLWFKANEGILENASNQITSWLDQSKNAKIATAVNGPIKIEDAINFNPVVKIENGDNDYFNINLDSIKNSNYTLITVVERNNANPNNYFLGTNSNKLNEGLHLGYRSNTVLTIGHYANDLDLDIDPNDNLKITPSIISAKLDQSVGRTLSEIREGSIKSITNNSIETLKGEGTGRLGRGFNDEGFEGKIAEVIAYSTSLNELEIQKIHSYLAIKYGISLDSQTSDLDNYILSDNTIIWNSLENENYHNNIVIIARDNISALSQQKSKSETLNAVLTLEKQNGISLDKTAIAIGSNNKSMGLSVNEAPDGFEVTERVWKMQKTGNLDNITLSFDFPINTGILSDYKLIVSDSANNINTSYTATIITENSISFDNIATTNNTFFRLAQIVRPKITELLPANNSTEIDVESNLTLTFNREITKGTGNVVIYDSLNDSVFETIDVTSDQISITNNQVSINPLNILDFGKNYYVLIEPSSFKDINNTNFLGITDNKFWSFTTKDTFVVDEFEYKITNTNEPFEIEVVNYLGDLKTITIPKAVTVFEKSFAVTRISDFAFFRSSINHININSNIKSIGTFAFTLTSLISVTSKSSSPPELPSNVINTRELVNLYIPENSSSVYSNANWTGFKTILEDNFILPNISSIYPLDDATDIKVNSDFKITFNENITKGSGNIIIFDTEQENAIASLSINSDNIILNDSTATIKLNENLDYNKNYHIQIDSTVFKDKTNNSFKGIVDTNTWNFTTADGFVIDDIVYKVTSNNSSLFVEIKDYKGTEVNNLTIPDIAVDAEQTFIVNSIGKNSFSNTELATITIGENITNIAENTFNNNVQLVKIISESLNPAILHSNAINDREKINLIIPKETKEAYINANWTGFKEIVEDNFEPPSIVSLTPSDNESLLDVVNKLEFTFNEQITKGNGNIIIYDALDDFVIKTISVSDESVVVNESKVTINLSDNLIAGVNYYIIIEEHTFKDLASFNFEGMYNKTFWNFSTKNTFTKDNFKYNVTSTRVNATVEVIDYLGTNTEIIVPNLVQDNGHNFYINHIGTNAFSQKNLTAITLPNSLVSIGVGALAINKLTHLTLPNSVNSIGNGAFSSNELINLTLSEALTEIPGDAFSKNKLTSIVIPNAVVTIEGGAFSQNLLTEVKLGKSLLTIGSGAFFSNQLTNIVLPKNLKTIEFWAFNNNKLTNLIIPNTVQKIGFGAFYNNKLKSLELGEGLQSIDGNAFDLNELTSVKSKKSNPVVLLSNAITNRNNIDLLIPLKSITAYNNANWTGFKSISEKDFIFIDNLTPCNQDTGIDLSSDLTVTFNKSMSKGTGSIYIYDSQDNSLVEMIDVNSTNVSINNSKSAKTVNSIIKINPSRNFLKSKNYYILIDAGAFIDENSNDFEGIKDKRIWSFETIQKEVPNITFANIIKEYSNLNFNLDATTNSTGSISYSIVSNGSDIANLSGNNNNIVSLKSVGTVNIKATVTGDANYLEAEKVVSLQSTPRDLEIKADVKTKTYGDLDPELTYQITNGSLINNDILTGTLTRETGENIGKYNVISSLENSNYTITFKPSILTINKRDIEITADAIIKQFGENDPEFTYQITNGSLVNNDSFSGVLIREAGEEIGEYKILEGSLALSNNYNLIYNGNIFTITDDVASVENNIISKSIKVFPNPVLNVLYIEIGNLQIEEIEIFNILGKRIWKSKKGENRINLIQFSKGLYFLKIKTNRGLAIKRVLKK